MEEFAAGAWGALRRAEIFLGGQWRRLTRIEEYKDGQWRQIAVFAQPLTLSVPDIVGTRRSGSTTSVSATATATPTGGLGPYSYNTVILTGGMTLSNGATANPVFSQVLAPNTQVTGTARTTCTDIAGSTASADFSITLRNLNPLDIEEPI